MDKFIRKLKELDQYLGATYINNCEPAIMIETPDIFPEPDMPKIILDTGVEHPKTALDMTYLKQKDIDKAIRQKLRKKYVYETDMHMIYNILVGNTNNQLQEKAALEATFQVFKTGRDPIG